MDSFSGLYIGLGSVFGLLFLGIAAELYYLLCWKKRRINSTELEDEDFKNKDKHKHLNSSNSQETITNPHQEPDLELELGRGEPIADEEEEDLELMGLYNLGGQPRFLFTINEETKEDLESEDGRSRKGSRNRSLGDIIMAIETPFFTPMASPPLKQPSLEPYRLHGFNPLFESSAELELNLNRLTSSPPPKFKFLRDAEEKLYKRLMEEAHRRASQVSDSASELQRKPINQRFHFSSSASQVLPLVSSPPEFHIVPDSKLLI